MTKCSFCHQKIGFFSNQIQFKDGTMGSKCIVKFGLGTRLNYFLGAKDFAKNYTVQEFIDFYNSGHTFDEVRDQYLSEDDKRFLEEKRQKAENKKNYADTLQKFKDDHAHKYSHFYIDLKKNKILRAKTFLEEFKIIDFADIINYQVNENGHTEYKHHGITRAVVGGTLAGGVGAIVGATTGGKNQNYTDHIGVVLNLRDGTNEEIVIHSLGKEKKDSLSAKWDESELRALISDIDAGLANVQSSQKTKKINNDIPEEIKKYKELADDGTITQEEFEAKKKQLLGL